MTRMFTRNVTVRRDGTVVLNDGTAHGSKVGLVAQCWDPDGDPDYRWSFDEYDHGAGIGELHSATRAGLVAQLEQVYDTTARVLRSLNVLSAARHELLGAADAIGARLGKNPLTAVLSDGAGRIAEGMDTLANMDPVRIEQNARAARREGK